MEKMQTRKKKIFQDVDKRRTTLSVLFSSELKVSCDNQINFIVNTVVSDRLYEEFELSLNPSSD